MSKKNFKEISENQIEAFVDYAERKNLSTLTQLLELGVDVNAKNTQGWTALHKASENGNRDVVRFLLNNGADVSITNRNGQTAFELAEISGYSMIHSNII